MQKRPVLVILCILCIHVNYESLAKFAIANDAEAAKVMCCRLQHSPQAFHHSKHNSHKTSFLISSPADSMVLFVFFVPFVAIKL